MTEQTDHPKAGDVVGDRTVIRVFPTQILFGQKEGDTPNCGAYITSLREWFDYERRAVGELGDAK